MPPEPFIESAGRTTVNRSSSYSSSIARYRRYSKRSETQRSTTGPVSRTSSQHNSNLADADLRHPTPGLQSLQGAYKRNVIKLEESAEAMSAGGSDIGEEVRRLNELDRSRSQGSSSGDVVLAPLNRQGSGGSGVQRENSIQSSHHGDISVIRRSSGGQSNLPSETQRSRASSYANSIVDTNNSARWGGYSPGGYVTSPVGSVQSGTSMIDRAARSKKRGSKRRSGLQRVIVEPMQEGKPLDSPLVSPAASSFRASEEHEASRQTSGSSFGKRYDRIAEQITEQLEDIAGTPPTTSHADYGHNEPSSEFRLGHETPQARGMALHRVQEHGMQIQEQPHADFSQALDRAFEPALSTDRRRSADTFQEAQIAFKDFDGVHFNPETEEFIEVDEDGHEVRRVSARNSSGTFSMDAVSILKQPLGRPGSMILGAPPPGESMVYYPAPVPRTLNLPKRLSQMPSAHVQANRKSQFVHDLTPEARRSAYWLPQDHMQGATPGSAHSGSHPSSHGRDSSRRSVEWPGTPSSSDHLGDSRQVSAEHSDLPASRHSDGSPQSAKEATSRHARVASNTPRGLLNERMSTNLSHMRNLPPQLRASLYFDHQSVPQDVEVQEQSAVATLDNILRASATAPVNAFTDHPYAGNVGKAIFSREKARRSSTTLNLMGEALAGDKDGKLRKRRSSFMNLLRRTSSGDKISETMKRTSSTDQLTSAMRKNGSRSSILFDLKDGGNKLQKRRSQLSVGDELDRPSGSATPGRMTPSAGTRTPGQEVDEHRFGTGGLIGQAQDSHAIPTEEEKHSLGQKLRNVLTDDQQVQQDFDEEDAQEDLEDQEPVFAAPTTLLAELQVRKAQQKSRNRTAATAYPDGMHSTLLELDAVEEINKRRRKQAKIKLAWEDPTAMNAEEQDADEDVPLGMLFPSKDGVLTKKLGDDRDWNRPLGLMEKRELEDSEPLSSRRNRLRGVAPDRRPYGFPTNGSQMDLTGKVTPEGMEVEDEENGEETLASRRQRMKTKAALDGAIEDVTNSGKKDDFTDDLISQFGGVKVKDASAKKATSPAPEEEETLAQRRARLTKEKAAGNAGLRSSASLANLLSANPVGQRQASREHQPAQGTLLHNSAQQKERERANLTSSNFRASTFGNVQQPLVDTQLHSSRPNALPNGLLGKHASAWAPVGGFAGGKYNNGTGGLAVQTSASTPILSPPGTHQSGYFPPMGTGMGMGMAGYGQQPAMMQGYGNANPYATLGRGQSMASMPVMSPMAMTMPMNMAMAGPGGMPMNAGSHGAVYQQQAMRPIGYGGGLGGGAMDWEPQLDATQRAAIDRWRMSVMQ